MKYTELIKEEDDTEISHLTETSRKNTTQNMIELEENEEESIIKINNKLPLKNDREKYNIDIIKFYESINILKEKENFEILKRLDNPADFLQFVFDLIHFAKKGFTYNSANLDIKICDTPICFSHQEYFLNTYKIIVKKLHKSIIIIKFIN